MRDADRRYLVFAYDDYYPCGALGDLHGSYDTAEEARVIAKGIFSDSVDIYDRVEGVFVEMEEATDA